MNRAQFTNIAFFLHYLGLLFLSFGLFIVAVTCMWVRLVVIVTAAQLHSTNPEFRFCVGSNPGNGTSENGPTVNKAKRLSSVNHSAEIIHHHHHHNQINFTLSS